MNSKLYKLKTIQLVVMLLASVMLILIVFTSLSQYETRYNTIETERIKETVERYAIQCYATEGAYPPDIEYLTEHYGLVIDLDKYIYEYEPVAENIKPSVQIFVRLDYQEK